MVVERGHHSVHDLSHLFEPDFQQSLRPHPPDIQAHLAKRRVDPDVQLHEVENLCHKRHMRSEVQHLEFNRVNAELRYVQQDVLRPPARRGGDLWLLLLRGDRRPVLPFLRAAGRLVLPLPL